MGVHPQDVLLHACPEQAGVSEVQAAVLKVRAEVRLLWSSLLEQRSTRARLTPAQAAVAALRTQQVDIDKSFQECRAVLDLKQSSQGGQPGGVPLVELALNYPDFTAALRSHSSQLQTAIMGCLQPSAAGRAGREQSRTQLLDSHPQEEALSAAAWLASKLAQQLDLAPVDLDSDQAATVAGEAEDAAARDEAQPVPQDGECSQTRATCASCSLHASTDFTLSPCRASI